MRNAFTQLAFTPSVQAAQQRDGSRAMLARHAEEAPEHNAEAGAAESAPLGPAEVAFIAEQRSFYMASVSETGWPYVQHRGGPRGFLKVVDATTLAFADFAGNRQFISVGNLAVNDRVALILVDYAHRVRLKILGRLRVQDLATSGPEAAADAGLLSPGYRARPQRRMTISVAGFDWNCPQHIPQRLDAEDVQRALDQRDGRIAELERQLAEAHA